MIICGQRRKIRIGVGEQIDQMYRKLRNQDEASAIRFVDKLTWGKKNAFRQYLMKIEDWGSFDMFFQR